MKIWGLLGLLASGSLLLSAAAADLRQATVKEVVNDVKIVPAGSAEGRSAKVHEQFKAPDLIRTGASSRAELVAADQTVTRVGANTVFSFEPVGRKINLQQGTVLFYSPEGQGGGVIQTAAATAAVTGTTLIVSTTKSGGFKVASIESKRTVVVRSNGQTRRLRPGQLVFVLPGGSLSPILNFRLQSQVQTAALVRGFQTPLGSTPEITNAVNDQERLIARGGATVDGTLIGDEATTDGVETHTEILGDLFARNSKLFSAFQRDVTINRTDLNFFGDNLIKGTDFSNAQQLGLEGFSTLLSQSDQLIAGRNITFDVPGISPNNYIQPVPGAPNFGFAASEKIVFLRDANFDQGFKTVSFAALDTIEARFLSSGSISNSYGDVYMGARTIVLVNAFISANHLTFGLPNASNSFSDIHVLANPNSPAVPGKVNVYSSVFQQTSSGTSYFLYQQIGPNGVDTAISNGHLKFIPFR